MGYDDDGCLTGYIQVGDGHPAAIAARLNASRHRPGEVRVLQWHATLALELKPECFRAIAPRHARLECLDVELLQIVCGKRADCRRAQVPRLHAHVALLRPMDNRVHTQLCLSLEFEFRYRDGPARGGINNRNPASFSR